MNNLNQASPVKESNPLALIDQKITEAISKLKFELEPESQKDLVKEIRELEAERQKIRVEAKIRTFNEKREYSVTAIKTIFDILKFLPEEDIITLDHKPNKNKIKKFPEFQQFIEDNPHIYFKFYEKGQVYRDFSTSRGLRREITTATCLGDEVKYFETFEEMLKYNSIRDKPLTYEDYIDRKYQLSGLKLDLENALAKYKTEAKALDPYELQMAELLSEGQLRDNYYQ